MGAHKRGGMWKDPGATSDDDRGLRVPGMAEMGGAGGMDLEQFEYPGGKSGADGSQNQSKIV